MFWRRRERGTPQEEAQPPREETRPEAGPLDGEPGEPAADEALSEESPTEPVDTEGPLEVERDAPRPAAISRAAEGLKARGERVVELFEEVEAEEGRGILPIHARRRDGSDAFFEVETRPWDEDTVAGVIGTAAVLRASRFSDASFEVLSAYPLPPEVRFFSTTSPAALFQLDLVLHGVDDPEGSAAAFTEAADRHWGLNLDYTPEGLPLVEELLLAALTDGSEEEPSDEPRTEEPEGEPPARPFVLDILAYSLGCYLGETLRRTLGSGSWSEAGEAGDPVLEFEDTVADPIGKARAFLENGPEDSVAFYATYALRELSPSDEGSPAPSSEA
jgi:hypothetical protein